MTRVGVTGHCDLTAATVAVVSGALRTVLGPHARRGRLVGVSCLARGADQLFATAVLELGGQLEVILPAPDYRERQIPIQEMEAFDRLVASASSVQLMNFERSCRAAYAASNSVLLGRVEMILAIWDGQPATRRGSTGDVVATARLRGIPTSVIWPLGAARESHQPCLAIAPAASSAKD